MFWKHNCTYICICPNGQALQVKYGLQMVNNFCPATVTLNKLRIHSSKDDTKCPQEGPYDSCGILKCYTLSLHSLAIGL